MNSDQGGLLNPFEAEAYVRALEAIPVAQVGSDKWMTQHDHLEKLNIQAHHSALSRHDEFVVDAFTLLEKGPILIHELLVIEAWKEKVFPKLIHSFSSITSLKAYIMLYHEATLCNLLEVLLYHESFSSTLGDSAVELSDYCMRKLTLLNSSHFTQWLQESTPSKSTHEELLRERSSSETLESQCFSLSYSISISCISLMRFLSEHLMSAFPLSLSSRMLNIHDLPICASYLLLNAPYKRTRKHEKTGRNITEIYQDMKWIAVAEEDRFKVSRVEGQIWLILYNILCEPKCMRNYQINSYRKQEILKSKKFINELLLDQIPNLMDLKRVMEELSIMDPPGPSPSALAIIEPVPELRTGILADISDIDSLVENSRKTYFSDDEDARRKHVEMLAHTYNLDNFEDVLDAPVCSECGKEASKRCSRCHLEWYCGRQCQVNAWKKHKNMCDLIAQDKQQGRKTAAAADQCMEAKQQVEHQTNFFPETTTRQSQRDTTPKILVTDIHSSNLDTMD